MSMKNSLFYRFLVIFAILLGWSYSLYPIRDQDYIETFNKLAKMRVPPKIETVLKKSQQLIEAAAEVGEELSMNEAVVQVVNSSASENRLPLAPFFAAELAGPVPPERSVDQPTPESGAESEIGAASDGVAEAELMEEANRAIIAAIAQKAGDDRKFAETFRAEAKRTAREKFEQLVEASLKRAAAADAAAEGSGIESRMPLEDAIMATAEEKNIELSNYFDIYGQEDPINREIVYFVRNATRGTVRLGLDLKGGTEFRVKFDTDEVKNAREVRDQIISVLRNRVDPFGVAEVEIRPNDDNTITVRTPQTDPAEVASIRDLIFKQAKLEFKMVHPQTDRLIASGESPSGPEWELVDMEQKDKRGRVDASKLWVQKNPVLSTDPSSPVAGRINRAQSVSDEFGLPQVSVELSQGGSLLMDATSRAKQQESATQIPQRMAMLLDGKAFSAPSIESAFGSQFRITGSFTVEEVNQLSLMLRSGNMPVKLEIDSEMSTSPTLGSALIQSGIKAMAIGLIVVVLFMLGYYRFAGLVAVMALLANVLLIFGTLPLVKAALTLPGIAGIVLTVGMAVDANVLIFERIREELNNGKTLATAIKNGYSRAFVTILDANLTTLFTAFFLYQFGTGTIRGFAVTLSIGICASMFTALFVTRWVFDLVQEFDCLKFLQNPKLMHSLLKPAETGRAAERGRLIPFLNFRAATTVLSIVFLIASVVIIGIRNKDAFSVDFTGGAAVVMEYSGASRVLPTDIQQALSEQGMDNSKVTYKSSTISTTQLLEVVIPESPRFVALREQFQADNMGVHDFVIPHLNKTFPDARLSNGATRDVGGLVGDEFQRKALLAIFSALLVIIVYISFRFEMSYAVGAVAALLHDVLICTGIFLAFGSRQISLTVIAALLTIIGYSLNDTIVVFDRIRENLDFHRKMKFTEVINLSINQTMSRTLLTSLTTLFVVLTLFLVGGGGEINDFALVMLAGIVVGTYSSIFVATPAMMTWQRYRSQKAQAETPTKKPASEPSV